MTSDSLNNKEKKIGYRTSKVNQIGRGLFQRIIAALAYSYSIIRVRTAKNHEHYSRHSDPVPNRVRPEDKSVVLAQSQFAGSRSLCILKAESACWMLLKFGLGTDVFLSRYRGEYLDDVTAESWRQLHDKKRHNEHPSPNICFEVK